MRGVAETMTVVTVGGIRDLAVLMYATIRPST
jgi:hypothetical protein